MNGPSGKSPVDVMPLLEIIGWRKKILNPGKRNQKSIYEWKAPLSQLILEEFKLKEDIPYNCTNKNCYQKEIGTKTTKPILEFINHGFLVLLRRVDENRRRITTPINLGPEQFDLEGHKLKLVATQMHSGGISYGHYVRYNKFDN